MPKAAKPRPGRPPSGPAGERVSEYPSLTVRIPRITHRSLHSLSALKHVPVWRLVDSAVSAYLGELPANERRLVSQFAAKMERE